MSDNVTYFRNGADALMRQLLSTFGISVLFWIGAKFEKSNWINSGYNRNYPEQRIFREKTNQHLVACNRQKQ